MANEIVTYRELCEQWASDISNGEEPPENVKEIIQINELGMLTTNSQIGVKERDLQQRAYLEGVLPCEMAFFVLKELERTNLFVRMFVNWETVLDGWEIPVTIELGRVTTTAVDCRGNWEEALDSYDLVQALKMELIHCATMTIIDFDWGRERYLFEQVIATLKRAQHLRIDRTDSDPT